MKNYLIIGASSGIGRQLAAQLADAGHRVFGTYHKHEMIADSSISWHPLDVLAAQYDLSFLSSELHGIAYCPGSIHLKPFARIPPADFLEDYKLQVLGAVRVLQEVLPRLKNVPQASVLLFSTVAVQTGFNFHSMVASSKGALEGLTRALAAELAPKIRVNCIAPSITDTPLAAGLLNTVEKKEANAQRHPLKSIGTPEDIAHLAEFLLSEKSGWITGQILHADGGMSAVK